MSELKACPFCGSEAARIELDGGFAWGECMKCGATSKVVLFITDTNDVRIAAAVKYWNTRPIEDELRAEIARLLEKLHDEMSQLEIATDLGNKRWLALNDIYEDGEKHNANWCKRKAQEGLSIK